MAKKDDSNQESQNPPATPKEKNPDDLVKFKNGTSWSGDHEFVPDEEGKMILKAAAFSHAPGDIISIKRYIAEARQQAGLGEIVEG
jgi:hypothetical protein